jgi:hypothetical protein
LAIVAKSWLVVAFFRAGKKYGIAIISLFYLTLLSIDYTILTRSNIDHCGLLLRLAKEALKEKL